MQIPSHVDARGQAKMVNVGAKALSRRLAYTLMTSFWWRG